MPPFSLWLTISSAYTCILFFSIKQIIPLIPLFITSMQQRGSSSCFCKQMLLLERLLRKDQVVKQQGGITLQSNLLLRSYLVTLICPQIMRYDNTVQRACTAQMVRNCTGLSLNCCYKSLGSTLPQRLSHVTAVKKHWHALRLKAKFWLLLLKRATGCDLPFRWPEEGLSQGQCGIQPCRTQRYPKLVCSRCYSASSPWMGARTCKPF